MGNYSPLTLASTSPSSWLSSHSLPQSPNSQPSISSYSKLSKSFATSSPAGKEDSKANARVVEIFASHREAWRREEKHMVDQIHADLEEIACLRAKVAELKRSEAKLKARVEKLTKEVGERE